MNYKNYQNARNLSWRILIDNAVTELPVKPVRICKNLGIAVHDYVPADDNDGVSFIKDGVPTILVSSVASPERRRFTVAHELCHILLGHTGTYDLQCREISPGDNQLEQEANVFASRLLAPACVLWGCGVCSAKEIAELCQISMTAAQFRMQRLGELYARDHSMRSTVGRGCFLLSPEERAVYQNFAGYIAAHKIRDLRP